MDYIDRFYGIGKEYAKNNKHNRIYGFRTNFSAFQDNKIKCKP